MNKTTANHGHRQQKWPPSAPHKALRSAPTPTRQMDGQQPPKQANINFGGVEGVYGPHNTLMLWQCIIAIIKERFEGHTHSQPHQNLYPLAWGVVTHPFDALPSSIRPHLGR
jgi:hypothetical protein